MNFNDIWKQLCRKRPALDRSDSMVEIKSETLQALLRQVYEQGQRAASQASSEATKRDPFDEFASNLFRR